MLSHHPEIRQTSITGEDFMLRYADILQSHIDKVSGNWKASWENDKSALQSELALGWYRFLGGDQVEQGKRLMTKTPMTIGSNRFFDFFPEGQMVILTRRGSDVVESHMKTFDSSFEEATLRWVKGAREIEKLRTSFPNQEGKGFLILRYEDLFADTRGNLEQVLDFLGLTRERFPFDKALNQGVVGSSTQKEQKGEVSWAKEETRSSDFDPTSRSANWSKSQHYRFDYLAGKYQEILGYERSVEKPGIDYKLYNYLTSLKHRLGLAN